MRAPERVFHTGAVFFSLLFFSLTHNDSKRKRERGKKAYINLHFDRFMFEAKKENRFLLDESKKEIVLKTKENHLPKWKDKHSVSPDVFLVLVFNLPSVLCFLNMYTYMRLILSRRSVSHIHIHISADPCRLIKNIFLHF